MIDPINILLRDYSQIVDLDEYNLLPANIRLAIEDASLEYSIKHNLLLLVPMMYRYCATLSKDNDLSKETHKDAVEMFLDEIETFAAGYLQAVFDSVTLLQALQSK